MVPLPFHLLVVLLCLLGLLGVVLLGLFLVVLLGLLVVLLLGLLVVLFLGLLVVVLFLGLLVVFLGPFLHVPFSSPQFEAISKLFLIVLALLAFPETPVGLPLYLTSGFEK